MRSFFIRTLAFAFAISISAFAVNSHSYNELVHEFDYNQDETLLVEEAPYELLFDGVTVYDVTYDSPKGGRVPAYLVLPASKGPFPAVVWGHWMDYKTSSREEFLDEALVLAHSGLASLLVDAPFVRPGFIADDDVLTSQYPIAQQQMVIDVRRGVDYLLSRGDIDANRLAYVGHSFDAGVGGILAGVEPRF
jgi:cephalosporin-C deacetylase-like acetyl esterase